MATHGVQEEEEGLEREEGQFLMSTAIPDKPGPCFHPSRHVSLLFQLRVETRLGGLESSLQFLCSSIKSHHFNNGH